MAGAPLGNNNAGKGKLIKSLIEKRLAERAAAQLIVDKLIDQAQEGDKIAIGMIFDRVDGKPMQAVELEANITSHEAALDSLK